MGDSQLPAICPNFRK